MRVLSRAFASFERLSFAAPIPLRTTVETIVARAAEEPVLALVALDAVVPAARFDHVVACPTADHVVAAHPDDRARPLVALSTSSQPRATMSPGLGSGHQGPFAVRPTPQPPLPPRRA